MDAKSRTNDSSTKEIVKESQEHPEPLYLSKQTTEHDSHGTVEPPPSSSSFSKTITELVMSQSTNKSAATPQFELPLTPSGLSTKSEEQNQNKATIPWLSASILPSVVNWDTLPEQVSPPPTFSPSYSWSHSCRAPLSRKFAHPCNCNQKSIYHHKPSPTSNNSLPPAAYTSPLHLYDPISKKCLPTSRRRDMLLKECHTYAASTFPLKAHHNPPCVYDDLVCDSRRYRCTCKPSLHLFYESNQTRFGCVPIGPTSSPDGRIICKSGSIYNVISKECQKIFDINELPPSYTTGVSATQFSFVTIVLIWILLLILIVTAKLRKLRTSNLYRNSPSAERRLHYGGSAYRHHTGQNTSAWLHPFIAAVNGHHHSSHHRSTVDRQSQSLAIDEPGNYNDTDFFLANGNRRINELLGDNNFTGSQQSLNNPPPKFEDIYPSCPATENPETIRPPSNEDLPSYDEAMKLQNTMPQGIPPDMKE